MDSKKTKVEPSSPAAGSVAELTDGIQQAISMLMDHIDNYHDCDVPENTEGPPERKALQGAPGLTVPRKPGERIAMSDHDCAAVSDTVRRFVGWLRRVFKRPQYMMGWDLGEDRDYWVKSRFNADGAIEIIDHGCNEHKTPNAGNEARRKSKGDLCTH